MLVEIVQQLVPMKQQAEHMLTLSCTPTDGHTLSLSHTPMDSHTLTLSHPPTDSPMLTLSHSPTCGHMLTLSHMPTDSPMVTSSHTPMDSHMLTLSHARGDGRLVPVVVATLSMTAVVRVVVRAMAATRDEMCCVGSPPLLPFASFHLHDHVARDAVGVPHLAYLTE